MPPDPGRREQSGPAQGVDDPRRQVRCSPARNVSLTVNGGVLILARVSEGVSEVRLMAAIRLGVARFVTAPAHVAACRCLDRAGNSEEPLHMPRRQEPLDTRFVL